MVVMMMLLVMCHFDEGDVVDTDVDDGGDDMSDDLGDGHVGDDCGAGDFGHVGNDVGDGDDVDLGDDQVCDCADDDDL